MTENIWLNVQKIHSFMEKITPPNLPILVIDDDPQIGKLITRLLQKRDFENITAIEKGLEGIDLIQNEEFSVIFLDLSLPDISGLEILKNIKENPNSKCKSARVIILTGLPSLESSVEAMKYGAYNYISKPMETDMFYNSFEDALDNFYQARREYLIDKYLKSHLNEDIFNLKRQLIEKDEKIKQLQEEIQNLKQNE